MGHPLESSRLQHSMKHWAAQQEMVLYLSFPVAMFWISNQAEYFEEYVIKRKREIYPPEDERQRKELEDFKERMRKRHEERLLRAAQE
ncbi:protein PET100 homolog, mitochondrial isoform X3 [Pelodiscus sinensis]|uniref:protein PET100 homolog, mitochondrial isoform X3 n=1 Tax=Pelodiscus sinensis TaxID=13735 RepID=UPI0003C4C7CD|nr:protein PET100 homolog, mitochondrial isoform X2 [Pelodiscus sinensis]|eukprot:XP_006120009.1 protein PET100 homolog, mitochondrial isoform X2 [Pelodiscus sinensis]